MLERVLETAEDIVVLGGGSKDKVVFAFPLKGEVAKHYFNQTVSNSEESSAEGFNQHWVYDSKSGLIKGSNTYLALRLDEKLREDGFSIPSPAQAIFLDERGKLSNDVYRDFGLVVYSEGEPNKEVARQVVSETKRKLPVVIPFSDLTYRIDEKSPHGVAFSFVKLPQSILSGKKAEEFLKGFNYTENSGACRLNHGRNGGWVAGWDRLFGSYGDGRVDWVAGEASRENLEEANTKFLERRYDAKIRKLEEKRRGLEEERKKEQEVFLESLRNS